MVDTKVLPRDLPENNEPSATAKTIVDDGVTVFATTITGLGNSMGAVRSIQPGNGVDVDNSDPLNPVITATSGGGDMFSAVYDPQDISSDAFARENMTGTQAISTVDGLQGELSNRYTKPESDILLNEKAGAIETDNALLSKLNKDGSNVGDATAKAEFLENITGLAVAQGDLLYVDADGKLARLPKGTAGQVLRQNAGLTGPEWASSESSLGTKVSATGAAIDFTGIPTGARRVTVMLNGVSGSAVTPVLIQMGSSSGVVTSGYTTSRSDLGGSVSTANLSTAFTFDVGGNPARAMTGSLVLDLMDPDANTWVGFGAVSVNANLQALASGGVSLPGELDRIRVAVGSGSFDAGDVNILVEF